MEGKKRFAGYPRIVVKGDAIEDIADKYFTCMNKIFEFEVNNNIVLMREVVRIIRASRASADTPLKEGNALPEAALQADDKIPTAKTLGALYSYILALCCEKGIDLAEAGLQKRIAIAAQVQGLQLSNGYISETTNALLAYKNAHTGEAASS